MPRASKMSPVMSHPPAVFNSGLVRMFSCVKTSNHANAAPATNRIPKTSAVYRTNGFIAYWNGYRDTPQLFRKLLDPLDHILGLVHDVANLRFDVCAGKYFEIQFGFFL